MSGHGLSGVVRTKYSSCGQITVSPGRVFDWKQRREKPGTTTRRTCIYVFHNATGDKLPIYASLASNIKSIKEEISKLVITPVHHMRLSWHGHVLEDSRTLVSYSIAHGHCMHLSCNVSGSEETQGDGSPSPRRLMPLSVSMIDDSERPMIVKLRVLARIYDKVLEVKLLLEAQTGISARDMRLTLGGRTLANEDTLIECGVRDDSAVLQLICVFGTMQLDSAVLRRNTHFANLGSAVEGLEFPVTVKEIWPSGRSHRCGLTTDTTIRTLKENVARRSGIQPEGQMLMHRGRVLQDDLTASYYNLDSGTTIDLALVGGSSAVRVARPPNVAMAPSQNTIRPPPAIRNNRLAHEDVVCASGDELLADMCCTEEGGDSLVLTGVGESLELPSELSHVSQAAEIGDSIEMPATDLVETVYPTIDAAAQLELSDPSAQLLFAGEDELSSMVVPNDDAIVQSSTAANELVQGIADELAQSSEDEQGIEYGGDDGRVEGHMADEYTAENLPNIANGSDDARLESQAANEESQEDMQGCAYGTQDAHGDIYIANDLPPEGEQGMDKPPQDEDSLAAAFENLQCIEQSAEDDAHLADPLALDSAEPAVTCCRSCNGTGTDFLGNPCACEAGQQATQEPRDEDVVNNWAGSKEAASEGDPCTD